MRATIRTILSEGPRLISRIIVGLLLSLLLQSQFDAVIASPSSINGAVKQNDFHGIYILGDLDKFFVPPTVYNPYIEGVAIRTQWRTLDDGTGHCNCADLAEIVSELQSTGKKMTLSIEAQDVPDYVLNAATDIYNATLQNSSKKVEPKPWDASSIAKYQLFMTNLANYQINGAALKDQSVVTGIRASVIGVGRLRDSQAGALFDSRNDISGVPYSRDVFIPSVIVNIHAVQDVFPKIPVWIAFFGMTDDPNNPVPLNSVLQPAINAEFDGVSNPRIGYWQELLEGTTPTADNYNGEWLYSAYEAGSSVGFQACGAWNGQTLCDWDPNDTSPSNGLALAYNTFGSRYLELYDDDAISSNESILSLWDNFLINPDDASNPLQLTGVTSAGQVSLSWNDISTLELGYNIERYVLPSTDWVPLHTLKRNTTSYVDTGLENGQTYCYRVYNNDGTRMIYSNTVCSTQSKSGIDTEPPTVSITDPSKGATVTGAVSVTASASDDVGVIGVQFQLDGSDLALEDLAAPYTLVWYTTTAADGPHSLTAIARDASGNVKTSTAVSVTVHNDVTAPVIKKVVAAVSPPSSVSITWNTDEPATSQVEYGLTTSYGSTTNIDQNLVLTHAMTLTGLLPNVKYHYRVKSMDISGNLAVSKDFHFKIVL